MTSERTAQKLSQVDIRPAPLERLAELLPPDQEARWRANMDRGQKLLSDRVVWNINSTAFGGGVAEMLQAIIGYARGGGVDARWLVIHGDEPFFAVTKRVHNFIHGSAGDSGELGAEEHAVYEEVLRRHHGDLLERVSSGDIVILHDPQTAGLVDVLHEADVHVVWRCHIGADKANEHTRKAWKFLRQYVEHADACVFTREQYAPDWVDRARLQIIPPSIDPFSLKNCDLDEADVDRVLRLVGLAPHGGDQAPVTFQARDGSEHTVRHHGDLTAEVCGPPPEGAPLVVQVSRWDRLKDMAGVMTAFVDFVAADHPESYLLLVGPDVKGVADDPEGAAVLEECEQQWRELPGDIQRRVLLVRVPMDDLDENAIVVNAIQRRAAVAVQKSFAEGFGLTVTEAMWKARAMVASTVGGIPDQIETGVQGVLVDPHDLAATGKAVSDLLADPDRARQLGDAARERVRGHFLGDRHLGQYIDLFDELIGS